MPDSSAIDQALVDKLLGDATLMALTPDGVFFDEAGASMVTGGNATRFVIVSLVDADDVGELNGGTAFEDGLYLIDPRALSSSGGDVRAAAARIKVVLHNQPLTVTGYTWMTVHKEGRAAGRVEVDEGDPSIRWNKRPAYYRVQMAPA